MKFTTKLIAIIQIILILNSGIFAVKESVSLSRSHMKRAHNRVHYKHHRTFMTTKSCPEVKFDIPMFMYGFISTIIGSFEQDVSELLAQVMGPGKKLDTCYEKLSVAFEERVKIEKKHIEEISDKIMKDKDKDKKIAYLKSIMKGKESEIEKYKNNPKMLCEMMANAEELEREKKQEQNHLADDMLLLLDNKDKTKFEDFNPNRSLMDKFCSFHLRDIITPDDSIGKLFTLLKQNNKPGLTFNQVKNSVKNQIEATKTTVESSSLFNFNFFSECSKLPTEENHNIKCYEVGVITYTKIFWDMLISTKTQDDKNEIKTCFKHFITNEMLTQLLEFSTEKIVEMIEKVLGFMFLRVVKSLYYSIRMLVSYIQSTTAKDISERSEKLGEVGGFAVKMLLSAACGRKRRLLKRMKLKKIR